MADYMTAQITIGGGLPRRLVPGLCAAITKEGLSLEWGEARFCPQSAQELLEVRCEVDGRLYLRLCDDDAAYGEFDQLEAFLFRHGIPYDRQSEGKYEYDPVVVFFRPPHDPVALLATSAGRVVTPAAPLWSLAARFSAAQIRRSTNGAKALAAFVRQFKRALPPQPPPLHDCEILTSRPKRHITRARGRASPSRKGLKNVHSVG